MKNYEYEDFDSETIKIPIKRSVNNQDYINNEINNLKAFVSDIYS